jgi:hypothetical protein
MKRHVIEGWLLLLYFEFIMRFRGFKALNEIVRNEEVGPTRTPRPPGSVDLCRAMDLRMRLLFQASHVSSTFGSYEVPAATSWFGG